MPSPGPPLHQRARAATDRARELATRLSVTATHTTLTLDRLVVTAAADSADHVSRRHSATGDLRRAAEQVRRVSVAAAGPPRPLDHRMEPQRT
ncbi:hypothetical protein ACU610_00230 [Geodermatophilus sp. URMC 61]|uniref:hypothetical protein n=1 Tax=Geodermatophilus sp. URMC 61 TaxID=3423411 RepID=UPI00406C8824